MSDIEVNEEKIPRIIHYCWFGRNEKPDIVKMCISSWGVLDDYKIIEWNEDNFDVNMTTYTRQAYEEKKFAFVSDYARLYILKQYGGIYLDTDVEVLKSLDCFLENKMFCGFEGNHGVNPGLILGSVKANSVLDELMEYYEKNDFIDKNGTLNTYTTVQNMTDMLLKYGLALLPYLRQEVHGVTVYEKTVFCPTEDERRTKNYSSDTFTVHHYAATWMRKDHAKKLKKPFYRLIMNTGANVGKTCRKIMGEEKWIRLRNGRLKRIYDFFRGI